MASTNFKIVANVRVQDRGSERVIRNLQKRPRSLKVGVLAPDADVQYTGEQGPTTVGEAAFFNEFGTVNIPPRSWLRAWVDGNRKRLANEQLRAYQQIVFPPFRNEVQTLNALGEKYVDEITGRIDAGIPPKNADFTIAKKGFDHPLIDSGLFIKSITHRVEE